MGWTVLYIAFGIVALWLLGEVLLQYKARLRWRLLAFTGFAGVVVGVLLPSVWVIVAGAVAFAVGQTYVTLSFRRGFSTGWAIGGRPGSSKRRRAGRSSSSGESAAGGSAPGRKALGKKGLGRTAAGKGAGGKGAAGTAAVGGAAAAVVGAVGAVGFGKGSDDDADDTTPGTAPLPAHEAGEREAGERPDAGAGAEADSRQGGAPAGAADETAAYPMYSDPAYGDTAYPDYGGAAYAAPATGDPQGAPGYAPYDGGYDPLTDPAPPSGSGSGSGSGYGYDGQGYAAYSDPYIGAQPPAYGPFEPFGDPSYGGDQYGGYPAAAGGQSYGETPPGGVWVPPQRGTEPAADPQGYPYPSGHGQDEPYRY
ncbi:hypothetical protein [Streptomyces sp. URMC 123]|uniref:hypothetical protein n=1 Tax=Streptomyces sp. URMC 123 TaxID=3423403 RepID=UPI003F1CE167